MSENQKTTGTDRLPFTGLGCPKCGYNLTGTTEPRCPECGEAFDPKQLRPYRDRLRTRWRVVITAVLLVVYLPNTWIFWIDYPWNDYRMTWIKMFPVLPALVPTAWLNEWLRLSDMLMYAGLLTFMIIIASVLLGRRSWKWLIPVCIVLLAFEVFNAYVSHALFRM